MDTDSANPGRREVITGAAAGALTLGAAVYVGSHGPDRTSAQKPEPAPASGPSTDDSTGDRRVDPHGETQAGITRPMPPQSMVQVFVFDRRAGVAPEQLLGGLSDLIVTLTSAPLGFDEPNDLTITVGLGLPLMRDVAPQVEWPADLPTFLREDLGSARGGDLMVQVGASSPAVQTSAQAALLTHLRPKATLLWSQLGSRGRQDELGVFRNGLGFYDGIALPRTSQLQDEGVWITPPGDVDSPWSGASFVVLRRLRMDIERWSAWSTAKQEDAIGRDKVTGAPLSGGVRNDNLELTAKHPDGAWKVPAGAHARRAFPVFVGRPLMFRRSFGYANSATAGGLPDEGVLFIAYLQDPATFVLTQQRMDEQDDLMTLSTCTGSGVFFIPRGFSQSRDLTAWLRDGPQWRDGFTQSS